jgi:NAD(P)-dependent dehydrogenase (short-subunit alcohol dehydrogenase family)
VPADLLRESLDALAEAVADRLGAPDVVVANAAIAGRRRSGSCRSPPTSIRWISSRLSTSRTRRSTVGWGPRTSAALEELSRKPLEVALGQVRQLDALPPAEAQEDPPEDVGVVLDRPQREARCFQG